MDPAPATTARARDALDGLAHDLRGMLGVALAGSRLMADDHPADPLARDTAAACRRVALVTERLINAARLEREHLDLGPAHLDVIARAAASRARREGLDGTVEVIADNDIPTCDLNAPLLERALADLAHLVAGSGGVAIELAAMDGEVRARGTRRGDPVDEPARSEGAASLALQLAAATAARHGGELVVDRSAGTFALGLPCWAGERQRRSGTSRSSVS